MYMHGLGRLFAFVAFLLESIEFTEDVPEV
jgi:hypothetical protein